uniref:Uncharacterized protein n=1 Tax=Anguilla anguilla TaxID=7936 RepID=A0A0E9VK32_ANGAN
MLAFSPPWCNHRILTRCSFFSGAFYI